MILNLIEYVPAESNCAFGTYDDRRLNNRRCKLNKKLTGATDLDNLILSHIVSVPARYDTIVSKRFLFGMHGIEKICIQDIAQTPTRQINCKRLPVVGTTVFDIRFFENLKAENASSQKLIGKTINHNGEQAYVGSRGEFTSTGLHNLPISTPKNIFLKFFGFCDTPGVLDILFELEPNRNLLSYSAEFQQEIQDSLASHDGYQFQGIILDKIAIFLES
jgi:hypothetical protein